MNHQTICINVKDLTIMHQKNTVVWDLDCSIPQGVMLAILGPNGSGKTTFLQSLLGIVKPVAGTIQINGAAYSPANNNVAYVPQKKDIDWTFPITVYEVVMMARLYHKKWYESVKKADHEIVAQALRSVKMEDFAHRHISQLSGGQQQRMFVARALAQQSDIILLDEPFTGIDIPTEQCIVAILHELKKSGKTVVVVHHDLNTVTDYFDWVFFMNVSHIALGPTSTTFTQENILKTFSKHNFIVK